MTRAGTRLGIRSVRHRAEAGPDLAVDRSGAHQVPLDVGALRALRGSALHLDIYAWLSEVPHVVPASADDRALAIVLVRQGPIAWRCVGCLVRCESREAAAQSAEDGV